MQKAAIIKKANMRSKVNDILQQLIQDRKFNAQCLERCKKKTEKRKSF